MEFLDYIKANFSRRKFFGAGAIVIAGISLLKFLPNRKRKKQHTARFLSQDGKLVEVDLQHIPRKEYKATTEQIRNWVHAKKYTGDSR